MNESIVKMIAASGAEYDVIPGNTRIEVETVDGQAYMLAVFGPKTNEGVKLNKVKWRAEEGGTYYFIDQESGKFEICEHADTRHYVDSEFHESNNYFKTWAEAEEALGKILEIFK